MEAVLAGLAAEGIDEHHTQEALERHTQEALQQTSALSASDCGALALRALEPLSQSASHFCPRWRKIPANSSFSYDWKFQRDKFTDKRNVLAHSVPPWSFLLEATICIPG
ncbi:MAG: hypothetical protein ACREQ3_23210, partial [Candidatus Binatia bacterium]